MAGSPRPRDQVATGAGAASPRGTGDTLSLSKTGVPVFATRFTGTSK